MSIQWGAIVTEGDVRVEQERAAVVATILKLHEQDSFDGSGFSKVAEGFDVGPALAELDSSTEWRFSKAPAGTYPPGWKSMHPMPKGPPGNRRPPEWRPAIDAMHFIGRANRPLPALSALVAAVRRQVGGTCGGMFHVSVLPAGGDLPDHNDKGEGTVLFLTLRASPDSIWRVNGGEFHCAPGEVWALDRDMRHGFDTAGEERVVVIMGCPPAVCDRLGFPLWTKTPV